MLQYIVKSSETDDILNQTRTALDAGCKWIEIKAPAEISDEILESVIEKVKPLAKVKEATLTIASRVTLAKKTEVDGVQLYEGDMPASAARMELEAGPIIGISVRNQGEVERNMHFDVDYFRMEPLFEKDAEHLDVLATIAAILRNARSDKPLAAAGDITADNVEGVLAAGAEGVAVDSSVAGEDESVADAISRLINRIKD